jgi:hypothetical protein
MSRPANPFDNASCRSFVKALNREEIYANRYHDLKHMWVNVEEFIERYYNQQGFHSVLGYQTPVEFEQRLMGLAVDSRSATMIVFGERGNAGVLKRGLGTRTQMPSSSQDPFSARRSKSI